MLCASASCSWLFFFFFFNDTATTEIYTLSLHDALPNSCPSTTDGSRLLPTWRPRTPNRSRWRTRSEEHTSELQSLAYLVCRLLLEKKKKKKKKQKKIKKKKKKKKKIKKKQKK